MSSLFGSKRSHETPMDFAYDRAPVDPTSPFLQRPRTASGFHNLSISSQSTNSFASQPKPQGTPFRNPSFNTPRPKRREIELLSETSGAESSPADNADAEDTPDPQPKIRTMVSSAKSKPLVFGDYGKNFAGSSPSRIDKRLARHIRSGQDKVRKRKRPRTDYELEHDYDSSSAEGHHRSQSPRRLPSSQGHQSTEIQKQNWFSTLLSGIESRPNLPNILSYYAQLTLNFFVVFMIMYLLYSFWSTVVSDVDQEAEKAKALVLEEMSQCMKEYTANRCGTDVRLPALEQVCRNWEMCMNRDSEAVGRARVSAHTFAVIVNSFVEPISWKAMIFVLLLLTTSILVNNLAFSMFRSKTAPHMPHIPAMPSMPPMPSFTSSYFPPHGPQPQQWPPQTHVHHNQQFGLGWGNGMGTGMQRLEYHDMKNGEGTENGNWNVSPSKRIMGPPATPSAREGQRGRSPSKEQRSPSKGDRFH